MQQVFRSPPRQTVNSIFRAGLAAVQGDSCVAHHLDAHPPGGPVYLVAIGKAACAMSSGAVRSLDEQIIRGTLSDIREKVRAAKITRTALILVGQVLAPGAFDNSRLYDPEHRHILRPKGVNTKSR